MKSSIIITVGLFKGLRAATAGRCQGAVWSFSFLQVQGSSLHAGYCLSAPDVLLIPAWVSSGFSSFLPLFHMHEVMKCGKSLLAE